MIPTYVQNQLDTSMPEQPLQNSQIQKSSKHITDKVDTIQQAMNNTQLQPQDMNDEKMHIEGEEEETTMGEGVVAVEGETTMDGKELPVVVQQPEVQST